MALSSTVQLRDGMSAVLRRIAANLNTVNERFDRLQNLTEQAAPTGLYSQFNSELSGVQQELSQTVNEVNELRSSLSSAEPPAADLVRTLKRVGTAFVGSKLVSGLVSASDELTQTTARLNLMNDGLQSTADLQELIYQSAMRSRGAYNATADAVSKMGLLAGDAFANNQETIAFVEQLNKQFKIAGTSAEGQAAAMLQITQAMGAGVLRGEELNSVFEQVPTVIQTIADYLGVSVGEIRNMAQEGQITASVVKSALLSAAEETNRKFAEMPLTWADVWTGAGNMAVMSLQPLLEAINWVANNIAVIAPLALGAASAFALFAVAANWTNICAAAVRALTAAQKMLNAVMSLNPVVLIIGSVLILIGVIAAYVNATNKAKNETTSAVGVICGLFAMAGAYLYNGFYVPVYNVIADLINFLCNVFHDPIASIEILFLQLSQYVVGTVRDMVSKIESLINLIPGVQIDITSGLDKFYDSYSDRIQSIKDKSGWTEYVKHKEKMEYSTAYANGYNWGANLQSGVSEKLGLSLPSDPATDLLTSIADNTAQIADDVSLSSDDIALLRDIAERQEINRYTTAEIKVEMVNNNQISSEMDLDGVVNLLEAKVSEALLTSAEGVHI